MTLTVTQDFGAASVLDQPDPHRAGEETVMRLLERNAQVSTRYGGGFVQSIDGLSGGHGGGRPIDWFFYVNGIEASQGAADTRVHDGDRIWWDRHDWSAAIHIPAVVGAYPEPFLHGSAGRRLPVIVECGAHATAPCRTVGDALTAAIRAFADGESALQGKFALAISANRGIGLPVVGR